MESDYEFSEYYRDLNNAFRIVQGSTSLTDQRDIMRQAVNLPAKRFYVSPKRLAEVVNDINRGRGIPLKRKSPRYEMYTELYRRFVEYREKHPESTIAETCSELVMQPAPKFYIKPSWGIRILYRGRNEQYEKEGRTTRIRKYHLRHNNDSTKKQNDKFR